MAIAGWAGNTAPATGIVAVTKSDSTVLNCRGLLCGTPGTANLTMIDGQVVTSVPLQQGYNPLAVKYVNTGGTADDIWALY